MAQNYEDIVREWYNRLRPAFMRKLSLQFPSLSLGDAENVYQDTFIAVFDNIQNGRVKEDTAWQSYIMTIGMNLAYKALRKISITDSLNGEEDKPEDEIPMSDNIEVQAVLGNELSHTPEPCATIVRLFYYENLSMEEIAEEVGYKNAQTAKAKKSQCMTDLIRRVTDALNRAGFDIKPKNRNRNGKN